MPAAISRSELIRKFQEFGYDVPFSGGKHQFMIKGSHKIRIPNPHGSKEISHGLLQEILKQAGLDKNQWDI